MNPFDPSTWQQQGRSKVTIAVLAPEHYQFLDRAIRNVFATDLALTSVAELIDGVPMVNTIFDMRSAWLNIKHPLCSHTKLCDGALEQASMFREAFDPAILSFDTSVMQCYQNVEPGPREFNMRLVELVAVAVHQTGVLLYQLKPKMHTDEEIQALTSWTAGPQWVEFGTKGRRMMLPAIKPWPTWFLHCQYADHDQYPHGLADVAAYWLEDRILGGIALFDRGESGAECNDVYFFSGRSNTTVRVWKFLDSQFEDLVTYLQSEPGSQPSPFPILASNRNRHRFDDWDTIARHHIFRDPWERKVPATKPDNGRDVQSVGDYPELEGMFDEMDALVKADEERRPGGDDEQRVPPQERPEPGEELPGRRRRRRRSSSSSIRMPRSRNISPVRRSQRTTPAIIPPDYDPAQRAICSAPDSPISWHPPESVGRRSVSPFRCPSPLQVNSGGYHDSETLPLEIHDIRDEADVESESGDKEADTSPQTTALRRCGGCCQSRA
ncbi:hypothetical protein QBC44DRAFT_302410 [Cladorrhinum sp. PSN332]|nr:hypothetical protein QBC44DRAFT_302410 [Cladorrhinum sp. PSN332]